MTARHGHDPAIDPVLDREQAAYEAEREDPIADWLCPECAFVAWERCYYCGSFYCEAHVLDHGPHCARELAADADTDARIDDLKIAEMED